MDNFQFASRLPLPSGGLFYDKVDGELVDYVEISDLTLEDYDIILDQNLLVTGEMLDVLLEKKVKSKIPINKLLIGDRLAILMILRARDEQFYKMSLIDPKTGKSFEHNLDLFQLQYKDIKINPNQEGLFDFTLPKMGTKITFRLMNGEDEKQIRLSQRNEEMYKKIKTSYNTLMLNRIITDIEGVIDPFEREKFIKNLSMKDGRELLKYINSVTPSINLEVQIPAPSGDTFRQTIRLEAEFFFPTN